MKGTLLATAASLFAVIGTPAWAQDNTAADENESGVDKGDIVVTANRTSSLLSKTPIAMTAIAGEDLVKSGITNPTQLDESVPNLSIVRNNGLQIVIRGVTSADNTEKGDPSAAFMLNGIYLARAQAQEVSFYDVERVEVLRGPQGTLYGRNSTAGVVNVLSTRPQREFGGSVSASYASFNDINGTAIINVPLGDTFAIRAAANIDRRDNFLIDGNPGDGVRLDPGKDNVAGRLSLLFKPTEDLSILLVGDYSKMKGVVTDFDSLTTNFYSNIVSNVGQEFIPAQFRDRSSKAYRTATQAIAQQGRRNNDDKGIMGEIAYTFGPATLTYLGSYREFERNEFQNYGGGAIPAITNADYWQTSHELRLAVGTGPFRVQVGGYYFKEKSDLALELFNLLGPNTGFQFIRNPTGAENKSIFGQATYEIIPDVKLTGGVRYSKDRKSRFGFTALNQYDLVTNGYNIGNITSTTILETTGADIGFSKITWRAGIDYDSPLGLIFASVSSGYKAGGFNDGCEVGMGAGCTFTRDALYYNPEGLIAYEAGFKFRISPAFRLNATVFHYDYKDLQITQVANICGPNGDVPCTVTRNAASAKIDGVELDAQIQPTDRFSVNLALNYLDARYSQFKPRPTTDLAGRRLDRSPQWTWSAGVKYWVPIGEGKLEADANIRFSSRYELTDLGSFAYFHQPSFTKTDLSLTYSAPGDRFYVGAFVKNLEDEVVVTAASAGFFGFSSFSDPRQFGVRAGVTF